MESEAQEAIAAVAAATQETAFEMGVEAFLVMEDMVESAVLQLARETAVEACATAADHATFLHSAWRGKVARRQFQVMKHAATALQAVQRGKVVRDEFEYVKSAAITAQTAARGYLARRKPKN